MPKLYEKIRDSEVAAGKSYDKAQAIAAGAYYNRTGHTVQEDMPHEQKTTPHNRTKEALEMIRKQMRRHR